MLTGTIPTEVVAMSGLGTQSRHVNAIIIGPNTLHFVSSFSSNVNAMERVPKLWNKSPDWEYTH